MLVTWSFPSAMTLDIRHALDALTEIQARPWSAVDVGCSTTSHIRSNVFSLKREYLNVCPGQFERLKDDGRYEQRETEY